MKSQLRMWLVQADFHRVVNAALERDWTVNALITLTYDTDPLICWRAIDAIGRSAERLALLRPERMKNHLRRLFWLMNDESGAIAWRAPETIGEIVRSNPDEFADFIPMLISLLDMEPEDRPRFLAGILYALSRIAEAAPAAVEQAIHKIQEALAEPDSQSRAMAVCCLARLGAFNLLSKRPELAIDHGKALVYRDGLLMETTVSRLVTEVLATG